MIVSDGKIDTITLPKKIKGDGELLVEGFGEEDILKLVVDTISYDQLNNNTDILPEWLLIDGINWFQWME